MQVNTVNRVRMYRFCSELPSSSKTGEVLSSLVQALASKLQISSSELYVSGSKLQA
jgi:hypothetical protein